MQDTRQILEQIADLRAQLPTGAVQEERGLILYRHLDAITSYADTIVDDPSEFEHELVDQEESHSTELDPGSYTDDGNHISTMTEIENTMQPESPSPMPLLESPHKSDEVLQDPSAFQQDQCQQRDPEAAVNISKLDDRSTSRSFHSYGQSLEQKVVPNSSKDEFCT